MKRTVCFWLGLVVLSGAARADIYTWVDAHGIRHFSDIAASNQAKRAGLPNLSHANNRVKTRTDSQAEPSGDASRRGVSGSSGAVDFGTPSIARPKDGATIRNAHGSVTVKLTVDGGADLRRGEQVAYYLDGSPIPKSPSTLTSLTLGGIARGAHTLSAALLYRGHEVRRAVPVTFYMKPPSAISPLNANQGGGTANAVSPLGAPVATPAGNVAGAPAAPRFNTTSGKAGSPSM